MCIRDRLNTCCLVLSKSVRSKFFLPLQGLWNGLALSLGSLGTKKENGDISTFIYRLESCYSSTKSVVSKVHRIVHSFIKNKIFFSLLKCEFLEFHFSITASCQQPKTELVRIYLPIPPRKRLLTFKCCLLFLFLASLHSGFKFWISSFFAFFVSGKRRLTNTSHRTGPKARMLSCKAV